jgi:hypothetical protein
MISQLPKAVCADRAQKLTVITSPTHGLEAIYIVPEDETLRPFMLPQHVWQQEAGRTRQTV